MNNLLKISSNKIFFNITHILLRGVKSKPQISAIPSEFASKELLEKLNFEKHDQDFKAALDRFQNDLKIKLSLLITPDKISSIKIDQNRTIGEVSTITYDRSTNEANPLSDSFIIVDFRNNKKFKTNISDALRKNLYPELKQSEYNGIVEFLNDSTISIRVKSVITQKDRQQLITKGEKLMISAKKNVDAIYGKIDGILKNQKEIKSFPKDLVYKSKEGFKAFVKEKHTTIESLWQKKMRELEN